MDIDGVQTYKGFEEMSRQLCDESQDQAYRWGISRSDCGEGSGLMISLYTWRDRSQALSEGVNL